MSAERLQGSSLVDEQEIASRILADRGERPLLLLTDFDGTLSDMAPTPDTAHVRPDVHLALSILAASPIVHLGVISGRRLADVRTRVGLHMDFVSGLHGLEIEGPGEAFHHPSLVGAAPIIRQIAADARQKLAWCPQVVLEDKTYALTCHVRRVDLADASRVEDEFLMVAQPFLDAGALKLLPGARAFELLPAVDWHKGRGLEWIRDSVERATGTPCQVVYFGDDRTDEDAFVALRQGDVGVGVGSRPHDHLIHFRLSGPVSVGRLLMALGVAAAKSVRIEGGVYR